MSAAPETIRGVLDAMIAEHERWLRTIGEHREAVAQADPRRAERCLSEQQACMASLADLESRRESLVRELASKIPALASRTRQGQRISITEVLEHVPEGEREPLRERAERLRALIERTRREQETLRLATSALAAHMEGLVRQVTRRLQRAATYSARGIAFAGPISSGVDLVQ